VKRYVLTSDARADLDSIWKYIARKSSAETATELLYRIRDVFPTLASSPSVGVRVSGAPQPDLRKFPMGNYLIYYRPKHGGVRIERVIHGKRQQSRALRRPQ